MSYNYSRRFWPPAPVLEVRIAASAQGRTVTVPALVDTGSDVTSIPLAAAQALGLLPLGPALVEGVAPTQVERMVFAAYISIDQGVPERLDAIGWPEDIALLGRDILNNYLITLDGPNLTLAISR